MDNISKEKCLIARDGEGKLIPVKVILESLDDKSEAMIIPLTKGEFQKIVQEPDSEDELIRTHIIDPSFTEEEFKYIKPAIYGAYKMAILALTTDTSQKEIRESSVKAVLELVEEKKKSIETSSS